MPTYLIVLIVILVILIAAVVVLYFLGKRQQRRQAEQEEQMAAMAQTVSILVIDKKMLPVKKSGLPQQVIDETPRLMRRTKMPIVKAKVGPKIMTLACEPKAYEVLPVKKEAKVVISGIYIKEVKSARGGLLTPPKKEGFFKRHFGRKKKNQDN